MQVTLDKYGRIVVPKPARDGLLVSTAEVAGDIDVQAVIDEVRVERSRKIAGLENAE